MSNALRNCKFRHGWIKPFLNAIRHGFSELNAANGAGEGTNAIRRLAASDPSFKAEYDAAKAAAKPRYGRRA